MKVFASVATQTEKSSVCDGIDIGTQTDEEDVVKEDNSKECEPLTAESLREVAESALVDNNVVYDQQTGMYFDYSTNLYYNPNLGLYYNYKDQTYLKYNAETKEYEFQYKLSGDTRPQQKKRERSVKENSIKENNCEEDEEPSLKKSKPNSCKEQISNGTIGQTIRNCYGYRKSVDNFLTVKSLSDSEVECITKLKHKKYTKKKVKSETCLEIISNEIESVDEYVAPCVRAMIMQSDVLEAGSLYIITCHGGSIGSASESDIMLTYDTFPNHCLSITYDDECRHYKLSILQKFHGIKFNENECTSETPIVITHKSALDILDTRIILHIHQGHYTCNDCEPGQMQEKLNLNKPNSAVQIIDKHQSRVQELKRLKKKFGLQKDSYVVKPSQYSSEYKDRANQRRATKGSDNPYEKTEVPSSVDKEIGSDNKGRQMLERMGWKSGQSLGNEGGLLEPVKCSGTVAKSGLGYKKQNPFN